LEQGGNTTDCTNDTFVSSTDDWKNPANFQ
jgi:hypothetical protein